VSKRQSVKKQEVTQVPEGKEKKKSALPKDLFREAEGTFRFKLISGEEVVGLIADNDKFNLLISTEDDRTLILPKHSVLYLEVVEEQ